MSPRVILVFLLLAMLTSSAFSWGWRWRRRRRSSSRPTPTSSPGSSPAGGPSSHPNAVVCTFYRSFNRLTCKKGGTKATCRTQPTNEPRDDRPNGPTPRGEYLIGKRYPHSTLLIDWYNLYPKKEDSSGYYGYWQRTAKGRNTMGLHPGQTSLGCVTVYASSSPYNSDPCWQKIRKVVDSGNMYYRRSYYSGFLYVK